MAFLIFCFKSSLFLYKLRHDQHGFKRTRLFTDSTKEQNNYQNIVDIFVKHPAKYFLLQLHLLA
jgi:hypothetical protein